MTSPIFTPKTSFSRIISDFSLFSRGFSKFDDDISVENRKNMSDIRGMGWEVCTADEPVRTCVWFLFRIVLSPMS